MKPPKYQGKGKRIQNTKFVVMFVSAQVIYLQIAIICYEFKVVLILSVICAISLSS